MGANPYELRLQLFQEAKNICWEEYNRDVNEFERQRDKQNELKEKYYDCLLYTSPSPRDRG